MMHFYHVQTHSSTIAVSAPLILLTIFTTMHPSTSNCPSKDFLFFPSITDLLLLNRNKHNVFVFFQSKKQLFRLFLLLIWNYCAQILHTNLISILSICTIFWLLISHCLDVRFTAVSSNLPTKLWRVRHIVMKIVVRAVFRIKTIGKMSNHKESIFSLRMPSTNFVTIFVLEKLKIANKENFTIKEKKKLVTK